MFIDPEAAVKVTQKMEEKNGLWDAKNAGSTS